MASFCTIVVVVVVVVTVQGVLTLRDHITTSCFGMRLTLPGSLHMQLDVEEVEDTDGMFEFFFTQGLKKMHFYSSMCGQISKMFTRFMSPM